MCDECCEVVAPTHWLPIPEPPILATPEPSRQAFMDSRLQAVYDKGEDCQECEVVNSTEWANLVTAVTWLVAERDHLAAENAQLTALATPSPRSET